MIDFDGMWERQTDAMIDEDYEYTRDKNKPDMYDVDVDLDDCPFDFGGYDD